MWEAMFWIVERSDEGSGGEAERERVEGSGVVIVGVWEPFLALDEFRVQVWKLHKIWWCQSCKGSEKKPERIRD